MSWSLWIFYSCAVITGLYILIWCHMRRARLLLANLPTFPQLPFIGSLHLFSGGGRAIYLHIVKLSKVMEEKQLPFVVWVGPLPILVLTDPEDVKTVNNTFIDKPYYYLFGKEWLGDGLVTAPSAIWKQSIKRIGATFVGSIVDGYQDVFNGQARLLVEKLKKDVGRKPFNILEEYLAFTTLETICHTALGMPGISQKIVTREYYCAFNKILELIIKRALNLLYHWKALYRLTPSYRELMRCIGMMHNISRTVIKNRKKEREELKEKGLFSENYSAEEPKTKFKPFIDVLLDIRDRDPSLSEEQIRAEIDTIIVGGQETVATTMFYALLMIGCKPRIQDKLYAEMREIFGDSKRAITKEDLSRMQYCEAVVNETLRLYPAIPGVLRHANTELTIRNCTIPKGATVAVNIWGAGHSKRMWGPDALEYRPERWLDSGPLGTPLGFSYGRRACIGKKYAMTLLKTMIAQCVRELEFHSEADKLDFKIDVAMKPICGHLIQMRARA